MMLQTGSLLCFHFLFLLCSLLLSPMLAYLLKDCTIVYVENATGAVSVDCEYRQLISIPDDIPRDVVTLTLKANDIRKINSADFYHLSNLQDLDLSWNAITHVDDGAFVHLVELKELHIDNNNLTALSDKMFQGLSNLLILSLHDNYIQSLSPAAFQSLHSLQELSLACNEITDIITIIQLPHLEVLNISIHELVSFQSKDLPLNMSSGLRELRVESDSIQMFSITTAVFPHLETIDLSLCCNDSGWEWDIPDKYFLRNITKVYFGDYSTSFNTIRKSLQSLDSLEYLHLPHMQWITDILNIACKIFTLRTLNLPNNNIKNCEKLTPCTQLTNLDLSFNDLTELSKGSIKQMKQLSHLNLACNKLSKVPDDVNNLSMLQMLDLQSNLINDLSCSDFLNLTRLRHLHLDMNHISELKQCVFQPLSELKVLTVNENAIMTLGDTFKTGLQKLEALDLSKNDLSTLNGDFTSLKLLKHLDLEFSDMMWAFTIADFEGLDELETLNVIIDINSVKLTSSLHQDEFPFLKSLKKLTIQYDGYNTDYTFFETISAMLSCLEHLEHFTAVNVYGQPSEYITYLPQLKTLTLKSGNLLSLRPEIFYLQKDLEALHLSNMKLKSLDFLAQANLTRLSWMDLSQNELTVINVSVFRFLPALMYVNMADNLFVCDCSNADFLKWMWDNKQTQVAAAHSYICAYPLAKNGTRLLDFDYHSCWKDSSFLCYISSTCVIVLTLLTSFTYHFLRLHLLYAYYLFLAFLYDAKERKRGCPQRYDAFISYNVHDELWVCREMLPVLEGEQGWRLCLHHRDFEPGKAIIENITEAIYGSRKTICVISRHYLQSEWCSREIQMASYRLFDEKKDVLILVFLEDIPAPQLSPYYRMRSLVKRHSYLSWPQAGQHPGLFWQNLRRALDTPHTDLGLNE